MSVRTSIFAHRSEILSQSEYLTSISRTASYLFLNKVCDLEKEWPWKIVEYSEYWQNFRHPLYCLCVLQTLVNIKQILKVNWEKKKWGSGGEKGGRKCPNQSWKRFMLQNCYSENCSQDCFLVSLSLVPWESQVYAVCLPSSPPTNNFEPASLVEFDRSIVVAKAFAISL